MFMYHIMSSFQFGFAKILQTFKDLHTQSEELHMLTCSNCKMLAYQYFPIKKFVHVNICFVNTLRIFMDKCTIVNTLKLIFTKPNKYFRQASLSIKHIAKPTKSINVQFRQQKVATAQVNSIYISVV